MSEKRTCAVCGKALPPRRMKYCSDACQREAVSTRRRALTKGRQGPKKRIIICPDCGRETSVYTTSIRCQTCQAEANARAQAEFKRRKAAGKTRPIGSIDLCLRCGKPYTVESGKQKYCKDCAAEAEKEASRKRGIKYYRDHYADDEAKAQRRSKRRLPQYSSIKCRECGRAFIPETRHAAYCSAKCAYEGHKRQCREWASKNKEKTADYMRGYKARKKKEETET